MCIWVCVSVSVVKKKKIKIKKEGVFDEILDWQLEGEERKEREKKRQKKKVRAILCNLCECACR